MKKVTVRDVAQYFGYRQLTGDDKSLDRPILESTINRPGLELAGYLDSKVNKRLIVIGEKESRYIKDMDKKSQKEVFDYLTGEKIPMILISRDLPCPEILFDIAQEKNFPIFSSYAPTSSLTVEITSFLEEFFVKYESVHGVFLQVYGRGVMITGSSGMGKSEIALELIKRGHLLVADDRVDVYRIHNSIKGTAPYILKNMLEIRGIGIIDVVSMFGVASTVDKATLDFVINLEKWDPTKEYDRIGTDNNLFVDFFGIKIPQLNIPVSEGRSIAPIIEAAVTNFILKSKGIDSSAMFENRVIEFINSQKEEQ